MTDETFAELERVLDVTGALEIVLTASFYQAVARMIQALDLEVEPAYRTLRSPQVFSSPDVSGKERVA